MSPRASSRVRVVRVAEDGASAARDFVAAEEPLEIRIVWGAGAGRITRTVAVTMRTPGDDVELAVGFLYAEGIVRAREQVVQVAHCDDGSPEPNVVEVRLARGTSVDEALIDRSFRVSSSCGLCGKGSLDSVLPRGEPLPADDMRVPAHLVASLPDRLRAVQVLFERTGGLHGAGLFDADGSLLAAREDVGRHNAVDKVVGHALLARGLPLARRILVVSGRASYEIVQKAAAAGVPFLVAVGAPSTSSVGLARRFGVTLVGFARAGGFNVYAGEQRVS